MGDHLSGSVVRPVSLLILAVAVATAAGCRLDGGVDGNGSPMNDNGNDNGTSSSDGLDPDAPPIIDGTWYRPGVDDTWHWQLQPDATGKINTSYDVAIYDLDLFDIDTSVIRSLQDEGRHVICYFSAGTFESFRGDADQFDPDDVGRALEDFADEAWLDITSSAVQAIMRKRLDLAVSKGCDAVEPDNVTGFLNNTGFDLDAADQVAFNRFIANEAHLRGLAVGLKNDVEQIEELVGYFDFAVNEQCHEFDECDVYDAFIDSGKPVFNAEYAEDFVTSAAQRAQLCAEATNQGLRTLVLPVDLDDGFRWSCDE